MGEVRFYTFQLYNSEKNIICTGGQNKSLWSNLLQPKLNHNCVFLSYSFPIPKNSKLLLTNLKKRATYILKILKSLI